MKIDHIALWARDIEKMKAFYETYFNATSNPKYINPEKQFSSYFLSFDTGTRLEIMQMPLVRDMKSNPYDQFFGYIHLAIAAGSEEKVDALTLKLAKDGYKVIDGPRKTGDGCYESVVLDPEDNRIEITV